MNYIILLELLIVELLAIIFFIIVIIVFILMFGLLFFVSFISKTFNFVSYLIFRNREDCPFCHSRKSLKIIKTENGYRKECDKCKFSVEVEDKKYNE